jgi:hypothetical protein
MFQRTLAITLLLGALASAAPKPTTKDFAAPCPVVWDAARTVIPKHYHVLALDDQGHAGAFEIGNGIMTQRRSLSFSLSGSGESCTVSVTGHFSGLANNDKGDFFKRIEDSLPKPEAPAAK